MRNFNYDDNEEYQPEIDHFFDGDGDDDDEFFDNQNEMIKAMELELVGSHLNLQLLHTAIAVAQRRWFWGLYSLKSQIRMIARTYLAFEKLLIAEEEEKKKKKEK